jgi:hypothetical protein
MSCTLHCSGKNPAELINVAPRTRSHGFGAHTADVRTASRRILCSWRRRRRRLANRSVTTRASKNSIPDTKRGKGRVQNVGPESAGKDVEGRGLARVHGRKWNKLYTDSAILCRAVQCIQRVQKGE